MSNTIIEKMEGKTVGLFLRETREARGMSLEEAAHITRIGKNYLVAIEADSFDKLPSAAYVKGFLRIYAGCLGLSGDEVVAMYEKDVRPQSATATDKVTPRKSQGEKLKKGHRGKWFISLLLLALVVIVSYVFEEKEEKPENGQPVATPPPVAVIPAPVQPAYTSAKKEPPAAPPLEAAKPEQPIIKPEQPIAKTQARAGGIFLKLKVNRDSRLNIVIDDDLSQQYDLKAGDLIEWKGEKVFTLDISNGGGIEAEFNGKQLGSFGPMDKPAHIVLKAENGQ